MKRSFLAVVCAFVIVMAPALALAQVLPNSPNSLDSAPLRPALPVVPNGTPPPGIIVQGRGVVRAPADTLRFNATLGGRNTPNNAVDTSGAGNAIVEALKRGGVADATVALLPNGQLSAYSPTIVTGSIRKPTRERVSELFAQAVSAAGPFPSVQLQNVNFMLIVDDCSAAESRAATAAIADARTRAQRFAAAAGASVGRVLSMNVSGVPSGSCATRPDQLVNSGFGQIDPSGSSDVAIAANVVITYALLTR